MASGFTALMSAYVIRHSIFSRSGTPILSANDFTFAGSNTSRRIAADISRWLATRNRTVSRSTGSRSSRWGQRCRSHATAAPGKAAPAVRVRSAIPQSARPILISILSDDAGFRSPGTSAHPPCSDGKNRAPPEPRSPLVLAAGAPAGEARSSSVKHRQHAAGPGFPAGKATTRRPAEESQPAPAAPARLYIRWSCSVSGHVRPGNEKAATAFPDLAGRPLAAFVFYLTIRPPPRNRR